MAHPTRGAVHKQLSGILDSIADAVFACVGGGSNAIGLFTAFLDDEGVEIHGFEPGGDGVETGRHAATIHAGGGGGGRGGRPHVRLFRGDPQLPEELVAGLRDHLPDLILQLRDVGHRQSGRLDRREDPRFGPCAPEEERTLRHRGARSGHRDR
jgi:hypothetical protein